MKKYLHVSLGLGIAFACYPAIAFAISYFDTGSILERAYFSAEENRVVSKQALDLAQSDYDSKNDKFWTAACDLILYKKQNMIVFTTPQSEIDKNCTDPVYDELHSK